MPPCSLTSTLRAAFAGLGAPPGWGKETPSAFHGLGAAAQSVPPGWLPLLPSVLLLTHLGVLGNVPQLRPASWALNIIPLWFPGPDSHAAMEGWGGCVTPGGLAGAAGAPVCLARRKLATTAVPGHRAAWHQLSLEHPVLGVFLSPFFLSGRQSLVASCQAAWSCQLLYRARTWGFLVLSGLNNPNSPSPSSQQRCSIPLILVPSSGHCLAPWDVPRWQIPTKLGPWEAGTVPGTA